MSFDKERFLLDRIEQLTQRGEELTAQRDAALAELAALKKRIADAPRILEYADSIRPDRKVEYAKVLLTWEDKK